MHVQLAFLASIVSPKVASAAAQSALEVLASEDIIAADLDNYLPKEEASNGSAEQAASLLPPAASESASKASTELKPASVAALPDGEVKAVEHEEEKANAIEAVKAEVTQQHDSIAASATAPPDGATLAPTVTALRVNSDRTVYYCGADSGLHGVTSVQQTLPAPARFHVLIRRWDAKLQKRIRG